MFLGFKNFHPLKGKINPSVPEICGDIVVRARSLLTARSDSEIFAAIEIINWMVYESSRQLKENDEVYLELSSSLREGRSPTFKGGFDEFFFRRNVYSATYALKEGQTEYDITGDENFPNATWAEFFAVLALGLVDQVNYQYTFRYEEFLKHPLTNDLFSAYGRWLRSSELLIDAMDAVATAEGIRRFDSRMADVTQKIKIRNKSAAIRKHAKTNEALIAFKNFYNKEKHQSMRNGAQLFCEAFPDKVAHLAPYNQVRTMSEGLSKLLKGQRSSLQS